MGEGIRIIFHSCGHDRFYPLSVNGSRYSQMQYSPSTFVIRKAFAVILWGALLLTLVTATHSAAYDMSPGMTVSSPAYANAVSVSRYTSTVAALYGKASNGVRISTSDLQQRQDLERSFQLAAFQQFDSRRTGRLYTVSVPGTPSGDVGAIRLRSGSFRRYGVNINEFTIPRGCIVNPTPERVLLVYTRFVNTSLFQSVPEGYVLASPVLSVLVYDALNVNTALLPTQISVSSTTLPISIRFPQSSSSKCAYFSDNSTDVNIFDLVQGVCQVDHLGTFALVTSGLAPAPAPAPVPNRARTPSPTRSKKRSNTWKIVVGSVVGGLALLALVTLLALGIGKRRKDAKLSRMEYQTEQGETLQMATIRNSRVPTATNTRTQATLVNDYAV